MSSFNYSLRGGNVRLQVVTVTILFLAICVLILPVEGFVIKNITAPTVITESGYYILQNDITDHENHVSEWCNISTEQRLTKL